MTRIGDGDLNPWLDLMIANCRRRGIRIPDDMPLDTREHRLAALHLLARLAAAHNRQVHCAVIRAGGFRFRAAPEDMP